MASRIRRFLCRTGESRGLNRYIGAQEEHHRSRTFQQEHRILLKRYGVDYDERYIWG
jgi:hypothetical protein